MMNVDEADVPFGSISEGSLFHMTIPVKNVTVFQESRSSWRVTVPYICDQAHNHEG